MSHKEKDRSVRQCVCVCVAKDPDCNSELISFIGRGTTGSLYLFGLQHGTLYHLPDGSDGISCPRCERSLLIYCIYTHSLYFLV